MPLCQNENLALSWRVTDEDAAASLTLFVLRHCAPQGSPAVDVVLHRSFKGFLWQGISLACSCANLQILSCWEMLLTIRMAQACVRILPPTLKTLRLWAPAALVDEPTWALQRSLSDLALKWPGGEESAIYKASGLMTLQSLVHLAIDNSDQILDETEEKLSADGFTFKLLSSLEFNFELFEGRPNFRTQCPALKTILALDNIYLPGWLYEQQIESLVLWSSEQLSAGNSAQLYISKLTVMQDNGDRSWKISDLLAMPRLQLFQVVPFDKDSSGGFLLEGSRDEYRILMRAMQLNLQVPASGVCENKREVAMQSNGHTTLCLCQACACIGP